MAKNINVFFDRDFLTGKYANVAKEEGNFIEILTFDFQRHYQDIFKYAQKPLTLNELKNSEAKEEIKRGKRYAFTQDLLENIEKGKNLTLKDADGALAKMGIEDSKLRSYIIALILQKPGPGILHKLGTTLSVSIINRCEVNLGFKRSMKPIEVNYNEKAQITTISLEQTLTNTDSETVGNMKLALEVMPDKSVHLKIASLNLHDTASAGWNKDKERILSSLKETGFRLIDNSAEVKVIISPKLISPLEKAINDLETSITELNNNPQSYRITEFYNSLAAYTQSVEKHPVKSHTSDILQAQTNLIQQAQSVLNRIKDKANNLLAKQQNHTKALVEIVRIDNKFTPLREAKAFIDNAGELNALQRSAIENLANESYSLKSIGITIARSIASLFNTKYSKSFLNDYQKARNRIIANKSNTVYPAKHFEHIENYLRTNHIPFNKSDSFETLCSLAKDAAAKQHKVSTLVYAEFEPIQKKASLLQTSLASLQSSIAQESEIKQEEKIKANKTEKNIQQRLKTYVQLICEDLKYINSVSKLDVNTIQQYDIQKRPALHEYHQFLLCEAIKDYDAYHKHTTLSEDVLLKFVSNESLKVNQFERLAAQQNSKADKLENRRFDSNQLEKAELNTVLRECITKSSTTDFDELKEIAYRQAYAYIRSHQLNRGKRPVRTCPLAEDMYDTTRFYPNNKLRSEKPEINSANKAENVWQELKSAGWLKEKSTNSFKPRTYSR
jgi:hypothetical protein